MTIHLVRHAEPKVVPSVDSRHWRLSEAGRMAATGLGPRLPRDAVWVSSTEPKAHETLRCAADPDIAVALDAGFDEVHREEAFDPDFRARRLAWVEGRLDERHEGWETPAEVAVRFERAVGVHTARGDALVVGSHGMALTAWLVHARGVVSPHDAGRFWQALAFPDVIDVP